MNKTQERPKWGGHQTGLRRDIATGSGPVFELRAALDAVDKATGGSGWSIERLARATGSSRATIGNHERNGTWPRSGRIQANLYSLARQHNLDIELPEDDGSGVFL